MFFFFYLSMQYLHHVHNFNPKYYFSHYVFFFVFLVLNVVAPPPVAMKGVHWAKDGPKLFCSVDGCNVSYIVKYNLVWHLQVHHNVTMEPGKPICPSTWEQIPKVQNHAAMNVRVLNNPLTWFHYNEQKAIVRARRHAFLEWDRFQVDL